MHEMNETFTPYLYTQDTCFARHPFASSTQGFAVSTATRPIRRRPSLPACLTHPTPFAPSLEPYMEVAICSAGNLTRMLAPAARPPIKARTCMYVRIYVQDTRRKLLCSVVWLVEFPAYESDLTEFVRDNGFECFFQVRINPAPSGRRTAGTQKLL